MTLIFIIMLVLSPLPSHSYFASSYSLISSATCLIGYFTPLFAYEKVKAGLFGDCMKYFFGNGTEIFWIWNRRFILRCYGRLCCIQYEILFCIKLSFIFIETTPTTFNDDAKKYHFKGNCFRLPRRLIPGYMIVM